MADVLSLPSWYSYGAASPYDSVVLDGLILGHPWCKARVSKVRRELIEQREKASGSDGGGIKLRGLQLSSFTITLRISDGIGEREWEKLCPKVLPIKDPKQRAAVPIYHPSLARFQITTVVVKAIDEEPPDEKGVLIVTISCVESREANKGSASTKPAKKSATYAPSIGVAKSVPKTATLADVRSGKRPSAKIDPT